MGPVPNETKLNSTKMIKNTNKIKIIKNISFRLKLTNKFSTSTGSNLDLLYFRKCHTTL